MNWMLELVVGWDEGLRLGTMQLIRNQGKKQDKEHLL